MLNLPLPDFSWKIEETLLAGYSLCLLENEMKNVALQNNMYATTTSQLTTKVTELLNRYGTPRNQDRSSDFQGVTLKKKKKHTQRQDTIVTSTDGLQDGFKNSEKV